MAANERLDQLSTTDASNTPAGSDVIGSSLDDELRSIKANIARSGREESTATASAAATLAVTVLNKIVPVSGSAAGSTTITLPAAATAGAGFRFTAWKTDNVNNVVIDADGSETINGGADYTMATQYEAAQFVTDGTSWVVESTAKREIGTSDLADDSVTLAKMEHGTSGDVLYYGASGAPTRLAKGTDGQVLGLASGIPAWQEEAARTPYGFYTTVNATDPTNDIDISAGACWDTTRSVWIEGSAMTKRGDAAWSAGNNGGFIDTSSMTTNQGYHVYVMINDVDGSVDYIMSRSETWSGVTKPTNYTKGQIISYIARTTAWVEGVWSENWFQYGESFYFLNDTTLVSDTLDSYEAWPAPANSMANIIVQALNLSPTGKDLVIYLKRGGAVGSSLSVHGILRVRMVTGTSVDVAQGVGWVRTDQNRDVLAGLRFTTTSPVLDLAVSSFVLADRLEATS